jgi:glycine cleavage system transcriptional repressor
MQRFFTIIMSAEFPEHRDPSVIIDHIRGVCRPFGVEVSLKDPKIETLQELPTDGTERYFLTAEGEDKPGMIRQISARLAQEEIDITDVFARRAENGQTFVMVMELAVPGGVDALALQQELEQLGSAVGLSAALQHEDIFSATNDPRPVRLSMRLRKSLTSKLEASTKVQPAGT